MAGEPVTVIRFGGCCSCGRSRGRVLQKRKEGIPELTVMHRKPGEEDVQPVGSRAAGTGKAWGRAVAWCIGGAGLEPEV